MGLPAIHYAGMVSAMTFARAEQIHGEFLTCLGSSAEDARTRMLSFLGWEEPDEDAFAPNVRILLVSGDSSTNPLPSRTHLVSLSTLTYTP